jgi:hypothetical protein
LSVPDGTDSEGGQQRKRIEFKIFNISS